MWSSKHDLEFALQIFLLRLLVSLLTMETNAIVLRHRKVEMKRERAEQGTVFESDIRKPSTLYANPKTNR